MTPWQEVRALAEKWRKVADFIPRPGDHVAVLRRMLACSRDPACTAAMQEAIAALESAARVRQQGEG
jgi:hypothetical protein